MVSMVSGATNAQIQTDPSTSRCHRRSSTPSGNDPSISRNPTVARPSAVRPTALRYTYPDASVSSGWVWSSVSYAEPTAEAVAPSATYTATGEAVAVSSHIPKTNSGRTPRISQPMPPPGCGSGCTNPRTATT